MTRLCAALTFTLAAFGTAGCASYGGDNALDAGGRRSMANSVAGSAASGGGQPEGTVIRSNK